MADQYRQGHILLDPIRAVPANAARVEPERPGHVVLARGESGREHVFRGGNVNLFQQNGNLFIEILGDDDVLLEHPEHGDIAIPPGLYRVVEQREAEGNDIGPHSERQSFD